LAGVAAQNNKEVRIALKGNACMVGNEKSLGLEVNGKLVVAKNYVNFQTDGKGTHFAVEAKDGKYGVCDSKGTFIYKCTYYKAQITGDLIRLQTTANSEPKFYRTATPTTEEKVRAVDPNAFNPEIRAVHELTVKKAKAIPTAAGGRNCM
jgi:Ca2+-dependent lipid-binding protein